MRRLFRAIIALVILVVLLAAAVAVYGVVIHVKSKDYLVTLEEKDLPNKAEVEEDNYVQLSEVKMHYVRYGTGSQPIVLIHGNGGSTDSLKELAQYLGADYSVYCIDSRCHGKSSDPETITYDLMAKDVKEFIFAKLAVRPYVLGHSDGAIVALTLAALYPDSLAACISCGANSHPDKFMFYFTWAVKIKNLFRKSKLNELMLTLPDLTPELLGQITVPTYVVAGEFDIMPLSDTLYIHEHIAGSKVAVVKWGTHSSYISRHGGRIYQLAKEFFAAQPGGTLFV